MAFLDRKAGVMAYCRIDTLSTEEAELLEQMYAAAVGYLAEAGIREPETGTHRLGQYDLLVNYLVLDSWDRRDVTITGGAVTENPAFRRILNQMKLTEPVPDSGTGQTE